MSHAGDALPTACASHIFNPPIFLHFHAIADTLSRKLLLCHHIQPKHGPFSTLCCVFVVHEGLHKWQASCPEASARSAPSSFFLTEGGCWKLSDGRAGLRAAVPQSLSPAFRDALSYLGASNLWKTRRNFFTES